MRCIVFAYNQLGCDCLSYLHQHADVVAVITHPDSLDQEGHLLFDSVAARAASYHIPVYIDPDFNDSTFLNLFDDCDIIFSFYYRKIIPLAILNKAPAFNMHGSLLPHYRGRCPVNWVILHGETETGVTLHQMTAKADEGAIVDQLATPIGPDDTAGDVMNRLNTLAVKVLERTIDRFKTGCWTLTEQDHEKATYFGGRKPEDGEVSWHWPAQRIHNMVRALQPQPLYPPAFGWIEGIKYSIIKSQLNHAPMPHSNVQLQLEPGQVLEKRRSNNFLITCGNNENLWIWVA